MKRNRSLVAHGLIGLGIVLGCMGLLTTRTLQRGRTELRVARGHLAASRLTLAVDHGRAAACAYVPTARHVSGAYELLVDVARKAEGQADSATALMAWQAIRTCALSTRWLEVVHRDELAVANASIARLMAAKPPPPGAAAQEQGQRQLDLHTALARRDYPRAVWTGTWLASFFVTAAGFVYLGWRGLGPRGKPLTRDFRIGLVLVLAGVALWVVSLWQA